MDLERLRSRLLLGFVLFHLSAITILSIPSPTGVRDNATWNNPVTQRQVMSWARVGHSLGLGRDPQSLVQWGRQVAIEVLDVRDVVVAPFVPYTRVVGAGQRWQMFASINSEPSRLSVSIRQGPDDPFVPLYIARDPAHAWRAEQLDQERSRGFMNDWSWGHDQNDYKYFARWLARQAARDFPEADALQVCMLQAKLPTPAQLESGHVPPEHAVWTETLTLAKYRDEGGP